MFNYLIGRGHVYKDLMWTYPVGLVHEFFVTASNEEQREKAFSAHVARISSYSSRDLTEKGNKEIEKIWSDLLKPLTSEAKDKVTALGQAKQKTKSENRAANSLFSVAKFKGVALEQPQG